MPDNSVIELRLMMLYVAQKSTNKLTVFIAPPCHIGSQILDASNIDPNQVIVLNGQQDSDILWSAEQCLKSGCVGVAVLWHQHFSNAQTKWLKLATQQGNSSLIVIRQPSILSSSLPVPLSLRISPDKNGLQIAINRQLGHWHKMPYCLNMRQQWPDLVEQILASNG